MDIASELRARIVTAADQLYDQNGRASFPTVDAVRRLARADMNAASAIMKEWRRMQTATPVNVSVTVPEQLRQSADTALASLWSQAQDLANENLRSAQAAWALERAEADAVREQVATAFQAQAQELDAATARIAELEALLTSNLEQVRGLSAQAETREAEAQQLRQREELAQQRADLTDRRLADLIPQLRRAQHDLDLARAERDAIAADLSRTDGEKATLRDQLDAVTRDLASTRDDLAKLRGELNAEHQNPADSTKSFAQKHKGRNAVPKANT